MSLQQHTVLVDGDIITYSVGFVAQEEPLLNALHSVKMMLHTIINETKADNYRIFLTGKDNYRKDIATIAPYKGNRKQEKPKHFNDIREYLVSVWKAEIIDGMEADDAMGYTQYNTMFADADVNGNSTIIATTDKDLNMIPGPHYNWRKNELYHVTRQEADMFFMKQLLMGDSVDNIKGVPGVGEKRATTIIKQSKSMADLYWSILCEYSKKYDKPFEAMMENANLLWIQRHKGELWNPLLAELSE